MAKNQVVKHDPHSIQSLFEDPQIVKQMARAMPKWLDPDRLLRLAVTAIRNNPTLLKCTKRSLLSSVMGSATLGLEIEPVLGQAYLVPFKNKWGQYEAQLIPGYRGYLTLARRSGEVQSVQAQCVYENDSFELKFGLDPKCDLIPADGKRGDVKGAFVIFNYKDGSYSFDYMTKLDIDKIRSRSKASQKGPWVTDYDEMAKKTVIRRHVKIAPLSVEMSQAAAAENLAIGGESQTDFFLASDDGAPKMVSLEADAEEFDIRVNVQTDGDPGLIDNVRAYTKMISAKMNMAAHEIKANALKDWEHFWEKFEDWQAKTAPKKEFIGDPTGQTARNSGDFNKKEPPAQKRAADMSPEELTIHRIKKASKNTIERVVVNNWEHIIASEEATALAKDKWEKSDAIDRPWPETPTEEPSPDSEALATLKQAKDQFGAMMVKDAIADLGYADKELNVDMANAIYERAMEIYSS